MDAMDARVISCSLLLFIMNLAYTTSQAAVFSMSQIQQHPESRTHYSSTQGRDNEEAAAYLSKGFVKLGSSPPSCEDKCYGCSPCEATHQVPKNTRRHLDYTNYELESWKCICGHSFYNP
ncbi:EPIDERMAL PATTERNING FACTOR-like protein 3 [Linum grandiflorum]